MALLVKNPPANARDLRDSGSIPGSGRSHGVGNGNPLQHYCLENPMDRGDCPATVHRVPKSWTRFRKGRGTRDQIANICWIIEKAREFQKNIYFCFIDYNTAIDCVDHNKLLKILKEMGIPDHLTCLMRNLYAGQEPTVRTGHGTTD